MKKKVFFISGHRDISEDEFNYLYKPKIQECIKKFNAYFVVGDYIGVDILSQNYIIDELHYDINKITVYHMNDKPMNINPNIKNLIGGFKDDIERDTAMTLNSDYDIAFVRENKLDSGTAQNIIRRVQFKSDKENGIELIIKPNINLKYAYINKPCFLCKFFTSKAIIGFEGICSALKKATKHMSTCRNWKPF